MQDNVESGVPGVKRGRFHAVIQSQPGHVNGVHAAFAEQPLELGVLKP